MSWCIIGLCVGSFSAIVEEQSRKKVVATESDFYFFYLLKVQLSIALSACKQQQKGILVDYFGSSHIFWLVLVLLLLLGGQIPSAYVAFFATAAMPCRVDVYKSLDRPIASPE